jgi:ubiquitin-like protein Pup
MEQQQKTRTSQPRPTEEANQEVPQGADVESDVEDLLDEIDDVLEANAEEFVSSFIQKGGQ